MWTMNFPDIQAGFRKGRGTRDQIANIRWFIEKAREFQKKHLFLLHWLMPEPLTVWIQQTVENCYRDGNTRPPGPASWDISMQVKKQRLDFDMEQQTGSKLG